MANALYQTTQGAVQLLSAELSKVSAWH